jgi:hypothetical protein
MSDQKHIMGVGINYTGALHKIKKSERLLQPLFEAFTNSLESIRLLKEKYNCFDNGHITISLLLTHDLLSEQTGEYDFQEMHITDTGIGFNDREFDRLIALNDESKGFGNKGTGRVQFLHTFKETKCTSIYRDKSSSTGFKQRKFTLSKSSSFLNRNAIICVDGDNEIQSAHSTTTLVFAGILLNKDKKFWKKLNGDILKQDIIKRYLSYFCENKENLPQITIRTLIDGKIKKELGIKADEIPDPEKQESIDIHYSKMNNNRIDKTPRKETFNLKSFRISHNDLKKNALQLISKGEVAKNIKLNSLLPTDEIENNRYLFLLSGEYIDNRDGDTRGEIDIPRKKDFAKQHSDSLFVEETILWEDIVQRTNDTIVKMYEEIAKKNEEKKKNLEELQNMFLLDPTVLKSLKNNISINDTDESILQKVYEADLKIIAKRDAHIKQQIEDLEKLDTTEKNYNEKLKVQVDEFVKVVPQQNRTALTQYVARRKLVLDLFGKIISKQLEIQKTTGKSIDEKLLHNLIFQQSSTDPETSDLWLMNEEFIYFRGTSEGQLGTILIDDDNIIKDNLSPEEEKYREKQEGDAKQKRPDILLFPKEGKCIIIEFKSLDTNISDHLNQINRYASLINNLSKDKYNFDTYYGYLIGENVDTDDIQDNDSDFVAAGKLDFIFRPHKRIVGKFGKNDGSLYTEIIKYSTILKRAQQRNEIFISKITKNINIEKQKGNEIDIPKLEK